MRAILLILIIVVLALILAVTTGLLHLHQTRSAQAPKVSVSGAGIRTSGGQTPTFDIETGSVAMGVSHRKAPAVTVTPANQQAGAANQTGNTSG